MLLLDPSWRQDEWCCAHCVYLNPITLGMHVFPTHVGKYSSNATSKCQTILILETSQSCISIISFFFLDWGLKQNILMSPPPKIRFKLFSWERIKKWKILIRVFHFKLHMEKKSKSLCFFHEYHLPSCFLCCLPATSLLLTLSETPPASNSVLMSF